MLEGFLGEENVRRDPGIRSGRALYLLEQWEDEAAHVADVMRRVARAEERRRLRALGLEWDEADDAGGGVGEGALG